MTNFFKKIVFATLTLVIMCVGYISIYAISDIQNQISFKNAALFIGAVLLAVGGEILFHNIFFKEKELVVLSSSALLEKAHTTQWY